ncbi:hypothetical protein AN477_20555 [Alicyclobacillus ferrooxydans]|uniref:Uncharacterized protein n=1 Tax=Alicyclobacillus ferrooxydans TaxID=471514 RepID=A0A0P9CY72_9BACL|nr:hypothetical protein AN477_20555 [Alicyclobacillus ferrooxydans]
MHPAPGKPANRQTGKPANRQTGKPANRQTGRPERTRGNVTTGNERAGHRYTASFGGAVFYMVYKSAV